MMQTFCLHPSSNDNSYMLVAAAACSPYWNLFCLLPVHLWKRSHSPSRTGECTRTRLVVIGLISSVTSSVRNLREPCRSSYMFYYGHCPKHTVQLFPFILTQLQNVAEETEILFKNIQEVDHWLFPLWICSFVLYCSFWVWSRSISTFNWEVNLNFPWMIFTYCSV